MYLLLSRILIYICTSILQFFLFLFFFFFFNDTATTEIYTLSYTTLFRSVLTDGDAIVVETSSIVEHLAVHHPGPAPDRKSTRLNSSHGYISYAVFCLKKKKNTTQNTKQLKPQHDTTMIKRLPQLTNTLLM